VDARIYLVLNQVLLVLGAGFSIANALIIFQYIVYRRRRRGALLVWRRPATPDYGLSLGIGVVLGLVVFYKLVFLHRQAFGEAMMFLYYAYLLPLSRTIRRGFYDEGIWADSNFVPYNEVGGISWREGEHRVTLVVISRLRNLARKLSVPLEHYAAARRLLRDKISAHDIQFAGTALDLGGHDERDDL
jgi:hypothetical protein